MAASRSDSRKETHRAQDMIAAGIEDDDVVASTVRGDVRGKFKTLFLRNVVSVTQVSGIVGSFVPTRFQFHQPR